MSGQESWVALGTRSVQRLQETTQAYTILNEAGAGAPAQVRLTFRAVWPALAAITTHAEAKLAAVRLQSTHRATALGRANNIRKQVLLCRNLWQAMSNHPSFAEQPLFAAAPAAGRASAASDASPQGARPGTVVSTSPLSADVAASGPRTPERGGLRQAGRAHAIGSANSQPGTRADGQRGIGSATRSSPVEDMRAAVQARSLDVLGRSLQEPMLARAPPTSASTSAPAPVRAPSPARVVAADQPASDAENADLRAQCRQLQQELADVRADLRAFRRLVRSRPGEPPSAPDPAPRDSPLVVSSGGGGGGSSGGSSLVNAAIASGDYSAGAFDARVKHMSATMLARLPTPIPNKRQNGYKLSDQRKDPRSRKPLAVGTIVEVQTVGSVDAFPVRFTHLSDPSARDKARDDFIEWAATSLDGLSREWFRALHVLAKCSKTWRRKYAKSRPTSWTEEDELTLEIADILILAEFVAFIHKQSIRPNSELAKLMEDKYRLERHVKEWLVGAQGLADAASHLRRCMRLELSQYAVVQPAQWSVLLDGKCVELLSSNVAAAPAPAPAARTRGKKAAGGGGGGSSTTNTRSSGSSVKCFRCHGSGHSWHACNNAMKPKEVRSTYVYGVLSNPPTPAYRKAAEMYLRSEILKLE